MGANCAGTVFTGIFWKCSAIIVSWFQSEEVQNAIFEAYGL